ncbi:myosin light chain kinase family member 4 [Colossoma macropomum]|uniref:myosin light chain kinase family member 4 n=1 Tax=Colossoma macropomum TaxID=42526 RepID=UPI0018649F0F|nr:myosin light chain kinase family member 4 [Colossoma macropomum]
MENFLRDKDVWIVGSVCLVASFLWRQFWSLFTHKRKRDKSTGSTSVHTEFKEKDGVEKPKVCLKGLKSQKKKKPPDVADAVQADLEEVQKLNQQNAELSHGNTESVASAAELLDLIRDEQEPQVEKEREKEKEVLKAVEEKEEDKDFLAEFKLDKRVEAQREISKEEEKEKIEKTEELSVPEVPPLLTPPCEISESSAVYQESSEENVDLTGSAKRRVTDENLEKDDLKKSRVEERSEEVEKSEEEEKPEVDSAEVGPEEPEEEIKEGEPTAEEYTIDCSPPPPAPFEHRVVTSKTHQIATYYTINRDEVLGGGRFGMVHKCVEKSSGLTLAAKIIKTRSQKEKEVVKSEIEVMNQLNHANLIQLYAAYESRYDITLIMEYVEGGELFDRIIDENYKLTELDTVLFIRQITEGLQYMHKMYILHLDLKPENILCVSRETNKIKIIDFGLARRYKPREKLRVNFGTPEFLAPEVINYEFVSFPTDMWSLGVITYMLLSSLSPFLGDDDNETLNNILECKWSFEEAEFADISDEAKDFITRLLVKSKSWRMSASQSLKHPWLSDRALHYRLHQKKNKCHSTRAPVPES